MLHDKTRQAPKRRLSLRLALRPPADHSANALLERTHLTDHRDADHLTWPLIDWMANFNESLLLHGLLFALLLVEPVERKGDSWSVLDAKPVAGSHVGRRARGAGTVFMLIAVGICSRGVFILIFILHPLRLHTRRRDGPSSQGRLNRVRVSSATSS